MASEYHVRHAPLSHRFTAGAARSTTYILIICRASVSSFWLGRYGVSWVFVFLIEASWRWCCQSKDHAWRIYGDDIGRTNYPCCACPRFALSSGWLLPFSAADAERGLHIRETWLWKMDGGFTITCFFKLWFHQVKVSYNSQPFGESCIPWNWAQKRIYLHEPFSMNSVMAGDLGSGAECWIKGSGTG